MIKEVEAKLSIIMYIIIIIHYYALPPVTKKYEIVTITYMNMADGFFNHDGRFKRRFGTSRTLKGKPYNDSIFKTLTSVRLCKLC